MCELTVVWCRGAWRLFWWVAPGVLQAGKKGRTPSERPSVHPSRTDTTMAREQPNVGDLLPLLETSDLHQLDEIRVLINEHLSTGTNAEVIFITLLLKSRGISMLELRSVPLQSEAPCYWTGWSTTFWKQILSRQCISSPQSENHMIRWEHLFCQDF